jgi:hypothetical protein
VKDFVDSIPWPVVVLVISPFLIYGFIETVKEWKEINRTEHPIVARATHRMHITQLCLICFGCLAVLPLSGIIGEDTLASWALLVLYILTLSVVIIDYTFRAGDKINAIEREVKASR